MEDMKLNSCYKCNSSVTFYEIKEVSLHICCVEGDVEEDVTGYSREFATKEWNKAHMLKW